MQRDRQIARRRLKTALLGGAAAMLMAGAAMAQDASIRFDIAAQDAGSALNDFSRQSGVRVLFPYDAVAGKHVPAVHGDMTIQEALDALTKATGLVVAANDGQTVTLTAPQSGSAAGDGADQGTVAALIVTAQKREENIQDVPIAMSAFTQEDLTRSQVAGGPDLMTQVPNFTFTKTNFSGYSIQIRGIGTQAISATTDAAVAVAENNTPFIRNRFFEQEFYDLERVEVLRGPQGTLYGRNATAGVVNIISAKPKNHFEAKLSADVGNYNSARLEGMLNLPLVDDKAALRIAGAWTKRDGYVKNILTGQQTDGRDLWSARATLGLTPADWFKANLVYEHFEETDDRLRSAKQLCHKDLGPEVIGGVPLSTDTGSAIQAGDNYFSQGCLPASLYSPLSYETPNGHSLAYYGPAGQIGSPVYLNLDPYLHGVQSRDLREIETHIVPEYEARNDTVELQLEFQLPHNLTLTSETGFNRDHIFSFEDFNRFDTTPGVFIPGANQNKFYIVDENGTFCDPQLGCTNRLAAGDLSTADSKQFSQEFRLSSNFDGPFNFNLGANFLRYDTEEKYYVFINSLTAWLATMSAIHWGPGQMDNSDFCLERGAPADQQQYRPSMRGYLYSNPNNIYGVPYQGGNCAYIDPNDIHNLNDEGRNYFLSKNPYDLLSYAVFGEAYYNIAPELKLTAGLRWTVDQKTAPQIPSWLLATESWGLPVRKVINLEWREPTGRLALDWKPTLSFTDETLFYGSFVRGYKAGGANPPRPVIVLTPYNDVGVSTATRQALIEDSLSHPDTFGPEFVNAYELGTKNTLLNGALVFNLSGFYYDYTGYQISQIVDRSAINLNFDATVRGLELETDWRPVENLRLGLKVGYEDTRLADGSQAIDLMDRTAGHAGWVVQKPFPPMPSNCIVPEWLAAWNGRLHGDLCSGYLTGTDPATQLPYQPNPVANPNEWGSGYPGYDPSTAPNNGEGFTKDLSGNALPNAPHYTATVTADYTLPLPNDWLMTLHTDLYYQSEAWTRVFNTPGYDKLKAYSNVNLAAIFTNEDAGWNIMAYVKNVFDKDNITGAFLNSDDTGLTTNVFLNEPRLFGLRVTKQWSEAPWWSELMHKDGVWDPFRVEVDGEYGRFSHAHDPFVVPDMALFTPDFQFPLAPQNDLDGGAGGGVKFTYQPNPHSWSISAAIRYGRASGSAEAHGQQALQDTCGKIGKYYSCRNPTTGQYTFTGPYGPGSLAKYSGGGVYNFFETITKNEESHAFADFMIGKEVGLGSWAGRAPASNVSVGLSYASFKATSEAELHGRPDTYYPSYAGALGGYSGNLKYPAHMHRFNATLAASDEFKGAGPSVRWDVAVPLIGEPEKTGAVALDLGVGGAVLFGKQRTHITGQKEGDYRSGVNQPNKYDITPQYITPVNISRAKTVSVPTLRANLGLSYALGGVKISGGYKAERYYKVIDGGFMERKAYDRTIDGPYFKVSVGFGG